MRIIRRHDELILANEVILYWFLAAGIITLLYGFLKSDIQWLTGGTVLILIAIISPTKSIVLDYKKKQLQIVTRSLILLYKTSIVFHIKDIKHIYCEDYKKHFGYNYRIMLVKNNDEVIMLTSLGSGEDIYMWNFKQLERMAKVLDEKLQDLKK